MALPQAISGTGYFGVTRTPRRPALLPSKSPAENMRMTERSRCSRGGYRRVLSEATANFRARKATKPRGGRRERHAAERVETCACYARQETLVEVEPAIRTERTQDPRWRSAEESRAGAGQPRMLDEHRIRPRPGLRRLTDAGSCCAENQSRQHRAHRTR